MSINQHSRGSLDIKRESTNHSLDRTPMNSAKRFVQEMTIAEILACRLEGDILLYEIKWANSWLDDKMLKELFNCASSLLDTFASTKCTNHHIDQQSNNSFETPSSDNQITVDTHQQDYETVNYEIHGNEIASDEVHESEIAPDDVTKGTLLYMCDICSIAFYSHESLSAHKLLCPGDDEIIQRSPSNVIETKDEHILTLFKEEYHTGSNPVEMRSNSLYECENCHITFADEEYLSRHKVRCKNHANSEFRCTTCQRGFTTKGSLELHVSAVHLKKKDFGCSICGKLFSRKHILKLHLATHYGERNYKCPTCEKTFVQKSNFSRHVRIHEAKNFGYKCRYCGQTFTQNKHVQKHVRTFHPDKYPDAT